LLAPFASCIDDRCPLIGGGYGAYVQIHWSGLVPGDNLPQHGMHIQLYPESGSSFVAYPLGVNGGTVRLTPQIVHTAVCFDYAGMENVGFRHMNDKDRFEAYHEPTGGTYATRVEMGRDETVVYEPYPYTFYTTDSLPPVVVVPGRGVDTVEIHCFPHNALHEFTYIIYDVTGVEHVASSRGTVSGMASALRMMTGQLAEEPATVLFPRSLALESGQGFGWNTNDTLQRVPVANFGAIPVSPQWFPAGWDDPATGWKGDWVIGAFSVFGPTGVNSQLTVECFTRAGYHHYASWGYWKGDWDDTVTAQLRGALGYWPGCPDDIQKGSPEAQTLWRKRNGGFDIVLENEGRLSIPVDVGIEAPVTGWDKVEIILE
jgi:hypothetical protein